MGLCTRSCRIIRLLDITHTNLRHRSDIEQEVNGLYTFDRKEKLEAERVKLLVEKALDSFYNGLDKAAVPQISH